MDLFNPAPGTRSGITPRDYQVTCHDQGFVLWDRGEIGTLYRVFTGGGKTIMACLAFDTWLQRGPDYRCMVVSYETQLVWQFAQEIEDVLGIKPGIEMDSESIEADRVPKIIVASRASLLRAPPPTEEQIAELLSFGIKDLGPSPARACKKFISFLRKDGEVDLVQEEIERLRNSPEASGSFWSRLHKFDWKLHWLICFDEAHRHAHHLASVGHVVDWFDQNEFSRRFGLTATPKRGDKVSIGFKMFPGIALDYPLYSPNKPCGVKEGYAVPYVQKYIQVEGVDFKSLAKVGKDFDEAGLEKILGEEETLAKLCIPLLDMVGDRRTLIFSPGVEMAKNVARFINARAECLCECGKKKWYARLLIGDGATCECGRLVDPKDITKDGEQARELDGSSPADLRKQVYRDHQEGKFQFLSVCGLCREGYNDPDIACVAIFRPVSKDASSLAEQMKGRSCRTLRGLIDGLASKEERLAAIAASAKPNALIVDLVGITGLADCASTVQIYADGLADILEAEGHETLEAERIAEELTDRAAEILAERSQEEEMPVEDAILQAKREHDEEREKARKEREAAEQRAREQAERRAKAGAETKYTTHDVGYGTQADPYVATDKQYQFAESRGMKINVLRSKKQIGRMIDQLLQRMPVEEVARTNGLGEGDWAPQGPSMGFIKFLKWKGVPVDRVKTTYDGLLFRDAKLDPDKFFQARKTAMEKARNGNDLTVVAKDIALVRGVLPSDVFDSLVRIGQERRKMFTVSNDPIPE